MSTDTLVLLALLPFMLAAAVAGYFAVGRRATREAEDAVRKSEERLARAVEVAGLGLFEHDHVAGTLYYSQTACQIFGYDANAQSSFAEYVAKVHPDDRDRVVSSIQRAHDPAGDGHYALDYRLRRPDGQVRWVSARSHTTFTSNGAERKPLRTVGAILDITERHRADEALRDSEERLATALEVAHVGLFEHDHVAGTLYWSPRALEIYGRERTGETSIDDYVKAMHPDDRPAAFAAVERAHDPRGDGQFALEHRILWPDGTVRWIGVRAQTSFEGEGSAAQAVRTVGAIIDVTERKETEQRMRELATRDALTGLANRTLAVDRLEHALAVAHRDGASAAVLYLDLDRFKTVNDSLGHTAGDALLVETATRLHSCLRSVDTVARLGGDEFLVILPTIASNRDALDVASRVLAALTRPFVIEGREVGVSASIGIALYPSDGADAAALLKNADAAMYAAKASGRDGCQFFAASMNEEALARLELETALRRALEGREFALHYQPQINLAEGSLVGFEALLRWYDEGSGAPVPPGKFIAVAEDSGLIVPLGAWVLEQACRDAVTWTPGVRVAVNVSARQLRHAGFADSVRRALRLSGLPPQRLELEVTESAIMEEPEVVAALLDTLRAEGVKLSIDDFGTGYSSLAYLKRLPLDTVKIDQSFVRDLPGDPADVAIVRAIISMAANLGLDAIAEGVETKVQAEFLYRSGCEFAQGYYFGRPVPAAALRDILKRQGSEAVVTLAPAAVLAYRRAAVMD